MPFDSTNLVQAETFLQGINVLKLTSAARMAGLSFKNGTLDKQGIIARLMMHPSILRACVGVLQRQAGEHDKNPFADALDDVVEQKPLPSPVIPASPDTDETLMRIQGRIDRVETTLAGKISSTDAQLIAQRYVKPVSEALASLAERATARLDALEQKQPVQINIGPITLPAISGQHERFPRMAKWLNVRVIDGETVKARTHVLLIGPAGTGKTTAAIAFAQMMGLDLYAQPLCMDYTGVTGFITATGEVIETEFTRAWKNGGVLLWDELSMSAPDAVGALNSALANGFISLPGVGNVKAHKNFYFIAGDNSDTGASILFNARTLLDGATLDRFVRIDWPVDLALENTLAQGQASWLACVRAIRAFIIERNIQHVGATSRAVIMGTQALQAGCFTRAEILEDTCKKGALVAEWPRVVSLPAVQTFLKG